MQISGKSKIAVLGIITGVVLLWSSRRPPVTPGSLQLHSPQHQGAGEPPNLNAKGEGSKYRLPRKYDKSIVSWLVFIAAIGFVPLAVYLGSSGLPVLAEMIFLISMSFLAFMLRGPALRHKLPIVGILLFFFCTELLIALVGAVNDFAKSTDALYILRLNIFITLAASIAVFLAVTWLRSWRFIESVAIGLISILLGALCFPGLSFLTEGIASPGPTGSALFFASGKASQDITLFASVSGSQSLPYGEYFQVNNVSRRPISWALLVAGGARLITRKLRDEPYNDLSVSSGVMRYDLMASGITLNTPGENAPAELFTGFLNPGSFATISGAPTGVFADFTGDRTAVMLPEYGQGVLTDLGRNTVKAVVGAVGSIPTYRSAAHFTVKVTSGPILSLDSIVSDNLTPIRNSLVQGNLSWAIHRPEAIGYATVNQTAADDATNLLFVFAVLLGVAGAGVIASLQIAIHELAHPCRYQLRESSSKAG